MFQMTSLGPPASGENIIKQPNKRMFSNSGQVLLLRSFGLSSLVFLVFKWIHSFLMLAIELEHYWSALSRGLSGRLDHLTPAWSLSIHSQTGVHYRSLSNIEMRLELWKLSEATPALPPKHRSGQQTRCCNSSNAQGTQIVSWHAL